MMIPVTKRFEHRQNRQHRFVRTDDAVAVPGLVIAAGLIEIVVAVFVAVVVEDDNDDEIDVGVVDEE